MAVNLSRKRVWLGFSVPGKKMIELAASANIEPLFNTQRYLFESYQGRPWKALLCAAIALHSLPELSAADRAAVLADTRDFLKLRFRALGLAEPPVAELIEDLTEGTLPDEVTPSSPDLAINYLVSALGALSADVATAAFATAACTLRDLSEQTGHRLAEEQYSSEDWAETAPLWDAAASWRPRRKAARKAAA